MLLYAVTIFLSACLLFQPQPLVGRYLLPWFGGTPAVWTTCLLFFQTVLFAGYLYAHRLSRLPPARQRRLHTALLALAVGLLALFAFDFGTPLAPPAPLKPEGSGEPIPRILGLLGLTVGLPYSLLASTGPLLQSWAARLPKPERVWRLFALSNLGSLLALLAYPFLLEPSLRLGVQAWGWSVLFVLFAAAAVAAARRASRAEPSAAVPFSGDERTLRPGDRLLWLALAATGSILLTATTNQMCQEVGSSDRPPPVTLPRGASQRSPQRAQQVVMPQHRRGCRCPDFSLAQALRRTTASPLPGDFSLERP